MPYAGVLEHVCFIGNDFNVIGGTSNQHVGCNGAAENK